MKKLAAKLAGQTKHLHLHTDQQSPVVKVVRADIPSTSSVLSTQRQTARRIHRKRAAEYLGVSLSWLDKSRMTKTGPAYIEIGGRVVYDVADLDAFLDSCRRN